jgi:hypothetical protein
MTGLIRCSRRACLENMDYAGDYPSFVYTQRPGLVTEHVNQSPSVIIQPEQAVH